jgi:hypothetical protein
MNHHLVWIVSPNGGLIWQARTAFGVYHIDHRTVIARFVPRDWSASGLVFVRQFAGIEEARDYCARHWRLNSPSRSGRRWVGSGV